MINFFIEMYMFALGSNKYTQQINGYCGGTVMANNRLYSGRFWNSIFSKIRIFLNIIVT